MIYRITLKLAKKINIGSLQALSADENFYGDWTARLFTSARTQYMLVTNTRSLYSVIMPGKGITNEESFSARTASVIEEFLRADGMENIFNRFIGPEKGRTYFSKALNRSVTGSMNDFVYMAKIDLEHFAFSLFEVSQRLNTCPMSYLEYGRPRDVFIRMMNGLA